MTSGSPDARVWPLRRAHLALAPRRGHYAHTRGCRGRGPRLVTIAPAVSGPTGQAGPTGAAGPDRPRPRRAVAVHACRPARGLGAGVALGAGPFRLAGRHAPRGTQPAPSTQRRAARAVRPRAGPAARPRQRPVREP